MKMILVAMPVVMSLMGCATEQEQPQTTTDYPDPMALGYARAQESPVERLKEDLERLSQKQEDQEAELDRLRQ
jgi:hypothetical protein